jgi:hypothetical protein
MPAAAVALGPYRSRWAEIPAPLACCSSVLPVRIRWIGCTEPHCVMKRVRDGCWPCLPEGPGHRTPRGERIGVGLTIVLPAAAGALRFRASRVHGPAGRRRRLPPVISRFTWGIELIPNEGHLRNKEFSGLRPALKDEPTSIDHLCRLTGVRRLISRTRSQDRDGATTCGTCHAPTG